MRGNEKKRRKWTYMDMEELVEDRVHVNCVIVDNREKKVKGEKEEGDSRGRKFMSNCEMRKLIS